MSFSARAKTLAEVAQRIAQGGDPGYEVRDFLHEFYLAPSFTIIARKPPRLGVKARNGMRLDAYIQALAVYLATQLGQDPPAWTQPPVRLRTPWFASRGPELRHYLLISSPAPFRARNLFIDEDSLKVI